MSELRIFIVDDEAPARSRLRVLLADLAPELPNVVAGEAEHGAAALEQLSQTPADVVLADIRMPVVDGIELAQHLARLSPAPACVFVTAFDQYAVKAFELNAVDYLLKPVRARRLKEALEKARRAAAIPAEVALRLNPEGRRYLSCGERGRVLLVPVPEIVFLRAEQKYVTARTVEREYLLEESLVQLEQEFPHRFIRIHRNSIVARAAVAGFERSHEGDAEGQWLILLKGVPDKLPVSRRQWPILKGTFASAAEAEK
ncbi:MAG: LytTR family DNA-binding domain-containing protein [Rhodocyclaceae bacterium]